MPHWLGSDGGRLLLASAVVVALGPFQVTAQAPPLCPRAHFFGSGRGSATPAGPLRVSEDGRLCGSVEQGTLSPDTRPQGVTPSNVSPGRAFLYSAVLPGAGQHLLGQGRWTPYAAVEIWGWIQFFLRRDQGNQLKERYRDLAWDVARRVSVGSRIDGSFGYYESLTQFRSSGALDRDPLTSGVQPETDPETFNGSVWQLAREIFFPPGAEEPPPPGSPAYQRALEYYLERSVSPRLAWDWSDNALQRSIYTDLIRESDEEFRNATTMIGLILANHFVSAIDALVSARLRQMGRDPEAFSLQPLPLAPEGRWGFWIRIRP